MKLSVLVIGIILLVIGGIMIAAGVGEFFGPCLLRSCDFGSVIGLGVLGGILFFVGLIVTGLGAFMKASPHLKELYRAQMPNPVIREKETVYTREVLIQCRSCGARYPQGTPRCLTCGANL